jgi:hypothetical protein
MPAASTSFEVGLALALVGVNFEAATTLASARTLVAEGAENELAERIRAQTDALKGHGRQARHHIAEIGGWLAEAGLPASPGPTSAAEYPSWVETTSEVWYATLDEEGANAYLAGWWLGQWTLAANVAAIGAYLADAAPDETWLREVVGSYSASMAAAQDGLTQARQAAPEALGAALDVALANLAAAGDPSALEPLEAAGALQEVLESLDGTLTQVRAVWAPSV